MMWCMCKNIYNDTPKLVRIFIFLLLLVIGCQEEDIPEEYTYTYSGLVNKLVDLETLASLPNTAEKAGLWSSYDRKSKYDRKLDAYLDWSANEDALGYIRKQGNYLVLAEMDGPGCIWRIWSAYPDKGDVRIYLDGKLLPSVDLPFENYFDGIQPPFNFSELVYNNSAKGRNSYIPIPYQTSCKIVALADRTWGGFYHFSYTTFPPETTLPTFNMNLNQKALNALSETNSFLEQNRGNYPYRYQHEDHILQGEVFLEAGDAEILADIAGPYAIKAIKIFLDFNGVDRQEEERMLRKIAFQIKWDNELDASVWSPLGDFFGTAPGVNEYKTLPLGMTKEMFYSYWYMPFNERALLEIINEDDVPHSMGYEIIYGNIKQPIETLGRFHAKWHRDVFPVEDNARWPDWTVLKTPGSGRFVGMMLTVRNPRSGRDRKSGG